MRQELVVDYFKWISRDLPRGYRQAVQITGHVVEILTETYQTQIKTAINFTGALCA
jgi:hypothetical protein